MGTIKGLLLLSTVTGMLSGQPDSLFVIVNGNEATVWHKNAKSNCASKFELDVSTHHDTITIIERDTVGPLVHCTCSFDLSIQFENFGGTYIVMVYRQDLKKYFYQKDTTYFIGSTSFTLPLNQLPYFGIRRHQSECGGAPVSVEERIKMLPKDIRLTAHPNPFNPATTIRFTLPASGFVLLKVFDLMGREIAMLKHEIVPAGEHTVQWDASSLPSGVYVCRLQEGTYVGINKLILVK